MKSSDYPLSLCVECNEKINHNLLICPQCHAAQGLEALAGIDPNIRIKNQKLAFWFSVLFGFFGLHKFYLGQYLKGSLYLVFSWTLVPMFVGWFDAFRTMKMSPFSFAQRYRRKVTHQYI
ncbi:TM2 domain-containing protein [Shewanella sp. UCD-KL12]|uniref:TM2 domain-containing protein n=1 Tax=Shewanella sp. UCD-KL12 TaxID=1917163 RepID=UPI00097070B3|nr:TM2 domain-containing protein [Shewanella sp. UCD-KL12]